MTRRRLRLHLPPTREAALLALAAEIKRDDERRPFIQKLAFDLAATAGDWLLVEDVEANNQWLVETAKRLAEQFPLPPGEEPEPGGLRELVEQMVADSGGDVDDQVPVEVIAGVYAEADTDTDQDKAVLARRVLALCAQPDGSHLGETFATLYDKLTDD